MSQYSERGKMPGSSLYRCGHKQGNQWISLDWDFWQETDFRFGFSVANMSKNTIRSVPTGFRGGPNFGPKKKYTFGSS